MKILILLPILLTFISCSSLAEKKSSPPPTSFLDKNISAKTTKVDSIFSSYSSASPGAAIAIVHNGEILYAQGYGSSNLEYELLNTPKTIFHLASVSKQFTAFAIALLEDQKKLSFDDDIRKYLPHMPDYGEIITIKDLIYHTSGLKDQWSLMAVAGWRSDDVFTEDQVMGMITSQTDLNFKPGRDFSYSNSNYTLLAKIVEEITQESFADWTRKNIFIPLKMYNTQFNDNHNKIIDGRAYSYEGQSGNYLKSGLNYATVGPTSLLSNAEDLALWMLNFQKPVIGNEHIIKKMMEVSPIAIGEEPAYAFGQGKKKYKNLNLVFHDGADAGYRSYVARFPEQQLGIAVLGNISSLPVEKLAMEIAELFLEDQIISETKEVRQKKEKNPISTSTNTEIGLNLYEGSYEIAKNMALKIWREKDILKGQITGKKSIHDLIWKSQHEFEIPTLKIALTFYPNDQGEILSVGLYMKTEGRNLTASKTKSFNPEKVRFEELLGRYFSPELSSLYILQISNGQLIAKNKRLEDIHLRPTNVDFFTGSEWFFKEIEIVRDSNNEVSGINISNNRAKNIFFKKVS